MKRTHRLLLVTAAAATLAAPAAALAEDSGFYVGAFVGYANVDVKQVEWNEAVLDAFSEFPGGTVASSSLDKNDTGFGATVGYRIIRNVAVELSYIDLGKATGRGAGTVSDGEVTVPIEISGDFESRGPAAALVGIVPFDSRWAIDGRVGVYYGDTKVSVTATSGGVSARASEKKSKAAFMGGVGVSYGFDEHWSARLDYLYFNKVGDKNTTGEADVSLAAAGIRYTF